MLARCIAILAAVCLGFGVGEYPSTVGSNKDSTRLAIAVG